MTVDSGPRALGSRYILTDCLGRGAAGEVWRARDVTTGDFVAAKVLKEQHGADTALVGRFVQERNVLLGLNHPQIVHVRDLIVEGTTLAIVMDLVDGPSLGEVLRSRGTLPPREAVELVIGILEALSAAHAADVVHRDIKPDNVLLADGDALSRDSVRLVDFGIAKIFDGPSSVRESVGTPNYMAPELVAYGRAFDVSDVYSVGVVLYQLLAGRTPFGGEGAPATIGMRHIDMMPPQLAIEPSLWRLVSGMLSKNPVHRLPATELITAFANLPPSALDAPALPVADEFHAWAPSPIPLPSRDEIDALLGDPSVGDQSHEEEPESEVASNDDPELTDLKDSTPMMKAVASSAAPTTAVEEPVGDSTMLSNMPRSDSADETFDTGSSKSPTRRGALIIAAVAIGVVLTTVLVFLALSGRLSGLVSRDQESEITTQPSQLVGEFTETGLRMDLAAAWDEESHQTRLTLTYSVAPGAVLSGQALIVLPDTDEGCASVGDDSTATRLKASVDGLDIPCGYYVELPRLEGSEKQNVVIPVDIALLNDGESLPDYSTWLKSVQQRTSDALDSMTGTRFPLQRITGITVSASSVSLVGTSATPVPYLVKAQWRGKSDSKLETDLLSSDTHDGMEVDALLDVTGGDGLDAVGIRTCSESRVIGSRILAEQPSDNCFVEVNVGILKATRNSFHARMQNG